MDDKDEKLIRNENISSKEIKYANNVRIINAVYTGEVLNGKRHEKGIQIWDDWTKYDGIWENDHYKGNWKNNRANGKGVYISKDGSTFEGDWIDDARNGFGTGKWRNGIHIKVIIIYGKKMDMENINGLIEIQMRDIWKK